MTNSLEKLDVKQMRLLLLLLEKKSLSRTAESLHVSQQAISMQLKTLRLIFDDPLFIRDGHSMVASPFAKKLGAVFVEIIPQLEQTLRPDKFEPNKIEQNFVISATDYGQQLITRELFSHLRQTAPNIKLIIKELEIETLSSSLAQGQIDLVITTPDFLAAHLPYRSLFNETYQLVQSANTAEVKINQISELNNYDHLIVSPSRANLIGSSTDWFEQRGVKRNIVASIPTFSMLADYVFNSDTLAFIPSRLLPNHKLRDVALPEYPPGFEAVLAWHPNTSHEPLHKWIIEQITLLTEAKR